MASTNTGRVDEFRPAVGDADACFICGDGPPVVVHEGLPLCEACHEAADHVERQRLPSESESADDAIDAITRTLVGAGFELHEVR